MSYQNGPPKIVTDGLVLCLDPIISKSYPGSGNTVYDLSGQGNNGTINGATYWSDGRGCFNFNGTNNYIAHTAINLYNISYSVSAWIKRDSTKTQGIMTDLQYAFWGFLITSNNALQMRHYDNLSTYTSNIVTTANDTIGLNWTHVAGVFDTTVGMSLYINGSLSNSNTNTNVSALNAGNRGAQYIGLYCNGAFSATSNPFGGNITCLNFYTRALSATEIAQNYNATKYRFGL